MEGAFTCRSYLCVEESIHMWELLMCGREHSHVGATHVWKGHSHVGVTHLWKGAFMCGSYSHVEGVFMCGS